MNKEEKEFFYRIGRGSLNLNGKFYYGLDYSITDFMNSLEQKNQKYKDVIHKVIEYIKIYRSYQKIDNKDYLKGRDEIGCLDIYQVDELLDILEEVK